MAASSVMFGVDIHPDFQKGISIPQIAREGFGFLSVKLSEGTSNAWELDTPTRPGSATWIRQGKAAGLVCLGYHYLQPNNITTQAQLFAGALKRCGVPGVVDAEAGYRLSDGTFVPTLTIGMIREFHIRLRELGANIAFLYLPKWYWQRIGSPPLDGLPALWASSYPSTQQAPASALFESVGPERWRSYGGSPVGVLQFAETALVAGRAIDANAFFGDQSSFARFVGATTKSRRRELMGYILHPTPPPPGTADDTVPGPGWPVIEDTLTTPGPAGGWSGRLLMHVTFGYRGAFVEEAWAAPSGKHFVPRYDPAKKTGGVYVKAFDTQHWELTPGDCALIVRYATRARGSAHPEPQN